MTLFQLWLVIKTWIVANQVGLVALLLYSFLEWLLPRIKWVRANSTIELFANLAKQAMIHRVPLLGWFVKQLATPPVADEKKEEASLKLGGAGGALVALLALGIALSGCATAGGRAFTACELGKLPAAGQTAFATAQQIASNLNSTSADLEAAALALAPGQLECGAKALLAWLESLAAPDPGTGASVGHALLAAAEDVTREHAKEVLRAFLTEHPATACGGRGRGALVASLR